MPDRREFLKGSAAFTALSYSRVYGANDRLPLGEAAATPGRNRRPCLRKRRSARKMGKKSPHILGQKC